MPPTGARILTLEEAAVVLRTTPHTVKRLLRSGALAGGFRLGREWRVDYDALQAALRRVP